MCGRPTSSPSDGGLRPPLKLLVTGITGFVGRSLTASLEADQRDWTVVGAGRDAGRLAACAESPVVEAVHAADLTGEDAVTTLSAAADIGRADVVVHLAALVTSFADDGPRAAELVSANTLGTLRVWRALSALPEGSRPARFVLASSVLVYGWPHATPVGEGAATEPSDNYGLSKLGAEEYSRYMAARLGIELVVLRLGYVYGPGDSSGKVVARFLRQAEEGRDLVVDADPSVFRDYVYIDDVVRALRLSSEPSAVQPGSYNISSGRATTIADLAGAALRVTGSRASVVEKRAAPGAGDEGYGCTVMDSSRAEAIFGPWTPLDEGLAWMHEGMRHA